ncbi:hypothetical protein ACFLQU_06155, partial [Verrucomicrobiota bacterium]
VSSAPYAGTARPAGPIRPPTAHAVNQTAFSADATNRVQIEVAATNDPLADVASLRADVEQRDRLIASLRAQRTNAPPRPRRRGRAEWMAELKKKDSKRYEELIKRREEAREQSRRQLAEMSAYYLNRDSEGMDDDGKAEHVKMLDLLEQTWRLTEQLQADPPSEERRQIFRSLVVNVHILAPMLQDERDQRFTELGTEMGYNEEEAVEFAGYLNEVIDLTTISGIFHGMRRGPPRSGSDDKQPAKPQP